MLVVAALRWVDARPVVDPLTGRVRTDPLSSGPSEADRCALEHALRLARGGRCVAVTVGPPQAEAVLRDALAAGAHEVLRVDGDPDTERATAHALATAVLARIGRPDVLVCGDHSADRGTGATPAHLATEFGAAQALGLLELARDGGGLVALRRLDGGRRERIAVPLPAVCSVEPTTVRLRRAPLPATLAAARAPVPVCAAEPSPPGARVTAVRPYRPRAKVLAAPDGPDVHERVLALTGALVDRTPPRVVTPDGPGAAADELLDYLRANGYLEDT